MDTPRSRVGICLSTWKRIFQHEMIKEKILSLHLSRICILQQICLQQCLNGNSVNPKNRTHLPCQEAETQFKMHNYTKKVLEAFKVLPNLVIGFYHNAIDAKVNQRCRICFQFCLAASIAHSLYSPYLGGKLLNFGC